MIDIDATPWLSDGLTQWSAAAEAAYTALLASPSPWRIALPWLSAPDDWSEGAIAAYQVAASALLANRLEPLRQQLNLGCEPDADDDLLLRKLAAAEATVTNDIGATPPLTYETAPAPLQEAILMFASHLYENREASVVGITAQLLPLGYADLISPYRKWVF